MVVMSPALTCPALSCTTKASLKRQAKAYNVNISSSFSNTGNCAAAMCWRNLGQSDQRACPCHAVHIALECYE